MTFRYGIGSMQIGRLLERAGSPEALLGMIFGFDHAAVIRDLADHGFDTIELASDLTLFVPEAFAPAQVNGLAALATERNLTYTVHLPLWSVEPASPQEPVRLGSVEATIRAIEQVRALNPAVYVLHATGALAAEFSRWRIPAVAKGALIGLLQERAKESIQEVLNATGLPSRALAIETVEFPFEQTVELAEDLDCSICLDVGHVLAGFSGPIDPFDALARVLPRLAEIHLHDAPWWGPDFTMRYDQDHCSLGKGDLNLDHLLTTLTAADWNGPIILELRLDEAVESLELLRSR